MSSIFSKIWKGEIPSYKIAENDKFYAFLDINPLAKGHTLVIPKQEVDYIFDIDDTLLSEMIVFAKQVAKAIETYIECQRIGLTVIGLEVPHAHIHLVPLQGLYDMDFKKAKLKLSAEEFTAIANKINTTFVSNIK